MNPPKFSSKYIFGFIVVAAVIAGAVVKRSLFMGASSSSNMSPPEIVPSKEKATATLIFLHGLGDTGHGWASMLRELKLNHIRCICPHAPLKPVSLNNGMVMPSWFDIKGLGPNSPEDEQGIKDASKELQELISKEVSQGIQPERIVIGGFSQGGAVALYTAFGTDTKVGGLLLLSTWMPLHKQFASESLLRKRQKKTCLGYITQPIVLLVVAARKKTTKYNKDIPVLQCHGLMDPMVPFQWGKATSEIVKSINPGAQFKSYPEMSHSSCAKEMEDVKTFLLQAVKESEASL